MVSNHCKLTYISCKAVDYFMSTFKQLEHGYDFETGERVELGVSKLVASGVEMYLHMSSSSCTHHMTRSMPTYTTMKTRSRLRSRERRRVCRKSQPPDCRVNQLTVNTGSQITDSRAINASSWC